MAPGGALPYRAHAMRSVFEAVRDACAGAVWSRGVDLARRDSVVRGPASDQELELRVGPRGAVGSHRVHLYPADAEWDCDCDAAQDPCEHVAAAVIALQHDLDAAPAAAPRLLRVGWRLRGVAGELAAARVAVDGDDEIPLRGSLEAHQAGRVEGPALDVRGEDRRVERALGPGSGPIAPGLMPGVLRALADCDDVRVDDAPVEVSNEPLLPRVRVEDAPGGFVLRLVAERGLGARFRNGAAICDGVLRPLGDPHLSRREREELARGRHVAADAAGELVSELLPSLQARLSVDVRSDHLPRGVVERPRLHLELRRDAGVLCVRADVAYGDPPRARVEDGRLVHLGGRVPLRDRRAEERIERDVRRELGLAPGAELRLNTDTAIELAPRLEAFASADARELLRGFRDAGTLEAALDVDPATGRIDVRFGATDGAAVDGAAVLRAWRDGGARVELDGGGFAALPARWLEEHGRRLADLLAARGADGQVPACALPDLARLCDAIGAPRPAGLEPLRALLEDFDGLPRARLPGDLRAELRDYQHRGVDWLCFLRDAGLGALLADDMGLGKTLQALAALRGRALVVAPTSVLHAWRTQAARFRPGLRVCIYHGPRRELDEDADLVLTSYAILRLDAARLSERRWDCVILDEAQAIKNPDSQAARAAHQLAADFRLALTGTPVENRLEELWSQLDFANPGLLGSRADFRERYARPIGEGDAGTAAHLRQRIAPFVLRRRKSEVASELPPRTEVELHCELGEVQRRVYETVLAAARRDVVERLDAGASALEVLEALLRLRQAACHTALVPGQREHASAKLEVLRESLEEGAAGGHRALVFSQWTSLLDLTEPVLRDAGLAWERLDGSTRDRSAVIERFQAADGPPVLLVSLRAGGTGVDLTAADHVYLLDPWWNPAVEDQAADRAHRIGQTRPVVVHQLLAADTVEERIRALQQRKRELAETVLGGAGRAASITRDELLALLD